MPWTREEAAAAGRKGGKASQEVQRRKREMSARERAVEAISRRDELGKLVRELLDAAHGQGDFKGLDPELRLKAVFRALEYGVGKPTVSKVAPSDDDPPVPTADDLFGDEDEEEDD